MTLEMPPIFNHVIFFHLYTQEIAMNRNDNLIVVTSINYGVIYHLARFGAVERDLTLSAAMKISKILAHNLRNALDDNNRIIISDGVKYMSLV